MTLKVIKRLNIPINPRKKDRWIQPFRPTLTKFIKKHDLKSNKEA